MKGLYLADQAHFVNALPPVDLNGGKNSDVWSMKNHAHATIVVQVGVSGGAAPIFKVQACDDLVPSNTTDLAFRVYKEETSNGDTLGAKVEAASTGVQISTNNDIMYVVEVDASELTADKPYMRVAIADPSASIIGSVLAILSGSRYANEQSATAIA